MKKENEVWMISNRQPWVEALARGLITCKTRSGAVHLPPVGAKVYLHASKALWCDWKALGWVGFWKINVKDLPRGGVVAVATVKAVGETESIMPDGDKNYFRCEDGYGHVWNCADTQTIVFENVKRIKFIPCKGSLVPTRKLPLELVPQ